jgi:SAM-dependent methyltransferase
LTPEDGSESETRSLLPPWVRFEAQRKESLAEATQSMFELAGIQPGALVLDVGSGSGDTALVAAERVGSRGRVLATDVSGESVSGLLVRRSQTRGFAPILVALMAAEDLALPRRRFDAALSRNCLMYVRDVPRAVRGIREALRPGARFAATVWGALDRNPFHAVPIAAVQALGTIPDPPPKYVLAFSLSAGDARAAFLEAGFSEVSVRTVRADRSYRSLPDALDQLREFSPLLELLDCVPPERRDLAWKEIERGFSPFVRPDVPQLRLPGEQLVVAGIA